MDILLLIKTIILGVVEGLTEFLPISSTGHLILASDFIFFTGEKSKIFTIVIQMGAILAVWWEYHIKIKTVFSGLLQRDAMAIKFTINLMIAFMPLALLGLLLGEYIKALLFQPVPVALAFIVGAFVIIWAEKREHNITIFEVDELTWKDALKLGFAQAFALIPGTSRSGATIIGGLLFGLSRKAAAEFSFFLAIPTLCIASTYDLYENRELLNFISDAPYFLVGMIAAFLSATLAIKCLLRYISHNDFIIFAWYRIAFGVLVISTSGLVTWAE